MLLHSSNLKPESCVLICTPVVIRSGNSAALSPEGFRKALFRWVVRRDIPFSAVEDPDFRLMFAPLDRPIPSADAIKREVMECYREEAARVYERLRSVGSKISLTLDCWTSPNGLAFLGVTAHYIDAQWTPHELVLDFLPLHDPPPSENLCEALVDVCDRAGILPKVLGVTSDNAANMNKLLVGFEGVCKGRNVTFNKSEQRASNTSDASCTS
jgi:hypothetical protein